MTASAASVQPPAGMRSRRIAADGLNWHVAEMGEGPAIVLVHGTAASVHSWRHVMPKLAVSHHVIAMDLPGHAGTEARSAADFSLSRMAGGLAQLLKQMGIEPEVVAGHSAGAAILVTACAHKSMQARSLVSFNGAFYPFGGAAGSLFSPIAKIIAANSFVPRLLAGVASRSTVMKLLRDTGSQLDEEGVDAYFSLFKTPSHVAAALGMMAAWNLSGLDDCLARLDENCIFVAGSKDTAVPPSDATRAAGKCRVAKVLSFAEYGHLLHEENPALAADIILGRMT